jgi:hypothetical protein
MCEIERLIPNLVDIYGLVSWSTRYSYSLELYYKKSRRQYRDYRREYRNIVVFTSNHLCLWS